MGLKTVFRVNLFFGPFLGSNLGLDLISILDPIARNVDHSPVEVAFWENPLNVDVNDDDRVQGALLCRPHQSWSLL